MVAMIVTPIADEWLVLLAGVGFVSQIAIVKHYTNYELRQMMFERMSFTETSPRSSHSKWTIMNSTECYWASLVLGNRHGRE